MKQTVLILFAICCTGFYSDAIAREISATIEKNSLTDSIPGNSKDHLNFFIISKRKKGKLDLATRFNVFRTKLRSLFHRKSFIAIVAKDPRHMSRKVCHKLKKRNANLGTIWFDSHGMYKKGYSLFLIGHDEVSYLTLRDSVVRTPFEELAAFADINTKLIIGSCYGGATYERLSIDYRDTTRMNGDSLMISLGKILKQGIVYGSESWVMSKPGLFWRRPAVGGNPGRKLFLDKCYEPAWKKIGVWNQYDATTGSFQSINPVALDTKGNLVIRGLPYVVEKNAWKDIDKKLVQLQPNLYK